MEEVYVHKKGGAPIRIQSGHSGSSYGEFIRFMESSKPVDYKLIKNESVNKIKVKLDEGKIIEREDYITQKQYEDLVNKYEVIQKKVNKLKNSGSYFYNPYSYGSLVESKNRYSLQIRLDLYRTSKTLVEYSISKEDVYILGLENIFKEEKDSYNTNRLEYFEELFKVIGKTSVKKLIYDIEFYKDKIITIQNFNEKEEYKDVYEIINQIG